MPASDLLNFSAAADHAALVRLNSTGAGLTLSYAGKTITLGSTSLGQVSLANVTFANGSVIVIGDGTDGTKADWYGQHYTLGSSTVSNQVWGLGGADLVETGSGNDWIVGNDGLSGIAHASSIGGVGAPTQTNFASISADGRYVAFTGGWTEFGSQANSSTDVIVKDMQADTASNENLTETGAFVGAGSGRPVISADGNWLTFWGNGALKSGTTGAIWMTNTHTNEVRVVSEKADGTDANGSTDFPDVSADGRYAVFQTTATNFAAGGDATYEDIYLKDLQTGALTRVTTSLSNGDANGHCINAHISADGRFVVFQSDATNLTAAETGSGYIDIYVWDRTTGDLVNLTAGGLTNLNNSSTNPDVGFDDGYGGVVVFQTPKGLLASDTDNATDIYAYYLSDGHFERVSTSATGAQSGLSSGDAAISADGRFVVFSSNDSSALLSSDTNGYGDVFVKDLLTGALALVSKPASGQANQASGNAEISAGGDWIVFESGATNLASTDANGTMADIFRVSNPLLKDTLRGGAGDDTYVVNRADVIVENPNKGTDTVRSSGSYTLGTNLENLVLTGSAGLNGTGNVLANVITGNAGANQLKGMDGNDILIGGAGADTSDGGNGADVIVINAVVGTSSDSGRVVVIGSNNDTGQDKLTNFSLAEDNLRIVATNVASFVHGTDTTIGAAGADVAGSKTAFSTATGLVELNQTNNNLFNDAGDIAVSFVTPSVALTEANFESRLQYVLTGTGAANTLTGGDLADSLDGAAGNDTLDGGAGNDTLIGGTGVDSLTGGTGKDTYVVGLTAAGALEDTVTETSAVASEIDTLKLTGASTNAAPVVIALNLGLAQVENINASETGSSKLNLSGNASANNLIGNAAANTLNGIGGNDVLDGQAGADRLIGGGGRDILTGGLGNDVFDFNAVGESGLTNTTWDVIKDFSAGHDRIDLSTIDADSSTAGDDPFTAIIGSAVAFSAAGQLKMDGGVLYGNTDADPDAEFAIELTAITNVALTDFVL